MALHWQKFIYSQRLPVPWPSTLSISHFPHPNKTPTILYDFNWHHYSTYWNTYLVFVCLVYKFDPLVTLCISYNYFDYGFFFLIFWKIRKLTSGSFEISIYNLVWVIPWLDNLSSHSTQFLFIYYVVRMRVIWIPELPIYLYICWCYVLFPKTHMTPFSGCLVAHPKVWNLKSLEKYYYIALSI